MKEKLFNPIFILILTSICFAIAFIDVRISYATSLPEMSIFGKIGTIGFIVGFLWILSIMFFIPLFKRLFNKR